MAVKGPYGSRQGTLRPKRGLQDIEPDLQEISQSMTTNQAKLVKAEAALIRFELVFFISFQDQKL